MASIKNTHFPTEPIIKVTGTKIRLDNGQTSTDFNSGADASTKANKTGTTSISVTKRKPRIFKYSAVVEIVPSTTYATGKDTANSAYSPTPSYITSGKWVGGVNAIKSGNEMKVNDKVEIYYTTNGKEPKRTKTYLYTGAITFNNNRLHDTSTGTGQAKRVNNTGGASSDNVIIKARAYYHGRWSKTAVAEFRILPQNGASK